MSTHDSKEDNTPTKRVGKKKTKRQQSDHFEAGNRETVDLDRDEASGFRRVSGFMEGGNFSSGSKGASSPENKVPVDEGGPATLHLRAWQKGESEGGESASQLEDEGVSHSPVTGWLVIVEGKGKGDSLPIRYGLHRIGRSRTQEICLKFGDDKISRENHASVEYDPQEKKFFLSKGSNLVYLNGKRVGQGAEREIVSGDEIKLSGETTLRFIALCGVGFDWDTGGDTES